MSVEISALIGVLSFVIGYVAHVRTGKKDVEEKASERATMNTQLSTISNGVQDIQVQVRSTEKRLDDVNDRVIRVEESTRSAHKRIDRVEGK